MLSGSHVCDPVTGRMLDDLRSVVIPSAHAPTGMAACGHTDQISLTASLQRICSVRYAFPIAPQGRFSVSRSLHGPAAAPKDWRTPIT
jgi:hypothetical protein